MRERRGAVWDVVTWDPVELEGDGDHMEGVGVGSEQPTLARLDALNCWMAVCKA